VPVETGVCADNRPGN